ncbi:MAG: hypothetical protein UY96_C0023G0008 [Parcubacteria group bacterium GW2011_GWB1_56_8]|nr:MAG: hypothetical protein UY96_C0023G0008 [Parcubacteria group bacterium GW2011_GWB1_56_8]
MKLHAKIGNQKGKPAYRTPSRFIVKQTIWRPYNQAKRLDRKSLKGKGKIEWRKA